METQRIGRHFLFTTKGTKPTKENPKDKGNFRRWSGLSCLSLVPLVILVVNDFDPQFPCVCMPQIETQGIGTHTLFTTKGTKATKENPRADDGGVGTVFLAAPSRPS